MRKPRKNDIPALYSELSRDDTMTDSSLNSLFQGSQTLESQCHQILGEENAQDVPVIELRKENEEKNSEKNSRPEVGFLFGKRKKISSK